MNEKQCNRCNLTKRLDEYYRKSQSSDGHTGTCKKCESEINKIWREQNKEIIAQRKKEYSAQHIEERQAYNQAYFQQNKGKLTQQNKDYRESHKEEIKKQRQEYRERTQEHIKKKREEYKSIRNAKNKTRRQNDINYRIEQNCRARIHRLLSNQRRKSYDDLIGCSTQRLRNWLEYQFADGMSWKNYKKWHIDHIIPLDLFDLTNENERDIAFNWKNLQPKWGSDNIAKLNRFIAHEFFNSIVSLHRFIQFHALNKEYQGVRATLHWLREELRYGKNLSDDFSTKISIKVLNEMDNPQPSFLSKVHNNLKDILRRRLND